MVDLRPRLGAHGTLFLLGSDPLKKLHKAAYGGSMDMFFLIGEKEWLALPLADTEVARLFNRMMKGFVN